MKSALQNKSVNIIYDLIKNKNKKSAASFQTLFILMANSCQPPHKGRHGLFWSMSGYTKTLRATKVDVSFIVKIHAVRTFFTHAVEKKKIHTERATKTLRLFPHLGCLLSTSPPSGQAEPV